MRLLSFLAVLLNALLFVPVAAAPLGGNPIRVDMETSALLPEWRAELPYVPDAAMVHDGLLHLARVTEDSIEFTSAPLTWQGIDLPPLDQDGKVTERWIVSKMERDTVPGIARLVGREGYWFVIPEREKRISVFSPSIESKDGLPVFVAEPEVPLARIDDLAVTDGYLVLLGLLAPDTLVATAEWENLGEEPTWRFGLPVEDLRYHAALFAARNQLFVAGGEATYGGRTVRPTVTYRAEIAPGGKPTNWMRQVRHLPREMGPVSSAEMNEMFFAVDRIPPSPEQSEDTLLNDYPTSQTFVYAQIRDDRFLSAWKELPTSLPRLRQPLLVPNEKEHQLLFLGGKIDGTGEENRMVWGITMPGSNALHRHNQRERLDERLASKGLTFVDYKAALTRARNESRYHVVFLSDDSPESAAFRKRINLDRNLRLMLEDPLLSTPSAEDLEAAVERLGVTGAPALGLLDPDGFPISVHQGIPADNAAMHQFLKPMWEPRTY